MSSLYWNNWLDYGLTIQEYWFDYQQGQTSSTPNLSHQFCGPPSFVSNHGLFPRKVKRPVRETNDLRVVPKLIECSYAATPSTCLHGPCIAA